MVLRLSTFPSDVRGVALTGLSTASSAAVTAADSVLTAFGKLQAQIALAGQASTAIPLMNGSAAAGTSTAWARGDHVHPTDTTRVGLTSNNTFTGQQAFTPGTVIAQPGSLALNVTAAGAGTNTSGFGGWFNLINITSDTIDAGGTGGNFIDGFAVGHNYGGSTATGGRQAIAGQLFFNAATSASNTNRNYVGVLAECIATAGDGGTSSAPLGGFFGLNAVAELTNAANALGMTACEFNVSCGTGSSAQYKTGIQVVALNTDVVRGSAVDAAIVVSAETGSVGFGCGIQFNAMSGHTPIINNGTLIQVEGPGVTLATGIDLSAWTTTGNLIQGQPGGGALSNTNLSLGGVQVVGPRITGWAVPTGNTSKASYDTGTVTLQTLAQIVAGLQDAMTAHGLIGA